MRTFTAQLGMGEGSMINLRKMSIEDISLFREWLFLPHVATWFQQPFDWIAEVEKQEGDFSWIHHFIAEYEGNPVGFCQYYASRDSGEPFGGYTEKGGTYSIDYIIGKTDCLCKGMGKQMVRALIEKIAVHDDAKRIVVDPEQENRASCRLLLSCGFVFDAETGIYVKEL